MALLGLGELRFAQHFPFSKTAQGIVKHSGTSIENVSEHTVQRAKVLVSSALQGKAYNPNIQAHSGLLREEVLAYPLAKILLSYSNNSFHFEKFAETVALQCYKKLDLELKQEKNSVLLDLAQELGMEFELGEQYFASVGLVEYLLYPKTFEELKLQNQKLESGKVFLSREEFAKLLKEAIKKKILGGLPVDTKSFPKKFSELSKELLQEHSQRQRIYFEKTALGKVAPSSFPPCLSEQYAMLSSGKKLSHIGNFTLATFLIAAGMQRDKVLELYKKAPNFDERIALYHIDRMFGFKGGKKYSVPSCGTMRSYALCIQNGALCLNTKSPMQYYRRKQRGEDIA